MSTNNQDVIFSTFFKETINNNQWISSLLDNNIVIISSTFSEQNCYFSQFNSIYLFCCGITENI